MPSSLRCHCWARRPAVGWFRRLRASGTSRAVGSPSRIPARGTSPRGDSRTGSSPSTASQSATSGSTGRRATSARVYKALRSSGRRQASSRSFARRSVPTRVALMLARGQRRSDFRLRPSKQRASARALGNSLSASPAGFSTCGSASHPKRHALHERSSGDCSTP